MIGARGQLLERLISSGRPMQALLGLGTVGAAGLIGQTMLPGLTQPAPTQRTTTTHAMPVDASAVQVGSYSGVGHKGVNTPQAYSLYERAQIAQYGSRQTPMTYMGLGSRGDAAAMQRISQFESWAKLASRGGKTEPVLGLEVAPGLSNSALPHVFNKNNPEFQQLARTMQNLQQQGVNVRVRFLSEANLLNNPWSITQSNGLENYKQAARTFKAEMPSNARLVFSPSIGKGASPLKMYEPGVYDIVGGTMYSTYKGAGQSAGAMYSSYYKTMQSVAPGLPYQIDEFGASVFHKQDALQFLRESRTNFPDLERVMLFDQPMRANAMTTLGMRGFTENGKSWVQTVVDGHGDSVLNIGQKPVAQKVVISVQAQGMGDAESFLAGSSGAAGLLGVGGLLRKRRRRSGQDAEGVESGIQEAVADLPEIKPQAASQSSSPIPASVAEAPQQPRFVPNAMPETEYQTLFEQSMDTLRKRGNHLPGKATSTGENVTFDMLSPMQKEDILAAAKDGVQAAQAAGQPQAHASHARVLELWEIHRAEIQAAHETEKILIRESAERTAARMVDPMGGLQLKELDLVDMTARRETQQQWMEKSASQLEHLGDVTELHAHDFLKRIKDFEHKLDGQKRRRMKRQAKQGVQEAAEVVQPKPAEIVRAAPTPEPHSVHVPEVRPKVHTEEVVQQIKQEAEHSQVWKEAADQAAKLLTSENALKAGAAAAGALAAVAVLHRGHEHHGRQARSRVHRAQTTALWAGLGTQALTGNSRLAIGAMMAGYVFKKSQQDIQHGRHPYTTIMHNSIVGAASVAVASKTLGLVGKARGFVSLKEHLARSPLRTAVSTGEDLARYLQEIPGVQRLLGLPTLALVAGVAVIPTAHSIIVRALAKATRQSNKNELQVMNPSLQTHQAGQSQGQMPTGQTFGNPKMSGSVRVQGQLRSHYNDRQARRSLLK